MRRLMPICSVFLFLFVFQSVFLSFSVHYSIGFEYESEKRAKEKQQEIDNLDDYWFKEEERVKQENEKEYERVRQDEEKKRQEKIERLAALIKHKIGEKLPPNYKGHDFQKIFAKYFDTLLGKGEFEKYDVYEKRLHSINLDEVYAFAITDKDTLEITYDPDKEVVDIEIKPLSAYRFLPKTDGDNSIWPFIILKTTKKKVSSYVGSNAFGAKKVIKKYEANKYGVQVEKNNSVSFSMPIREAKKYKDNMSILLICKPQIKNDVLAFIGSYYSEPTFDNPVEISYGVLGLNMELLSIWVYDSKTGKIHHKQHMEQN